MAFRINGFGGVQDSKKPSVAVEPEQRTIVPRKSIVQIHFPGRGMELSYYNDLFDLKIGDRVYVEGKMEGLIGYVMDIHYSFKIKLSDYKKVIAVIDTNVHGQFYMTGSHFITFDPNVIPATQITTWFKAPSADEEYVTGDEENSFQLDNLAGMHVSGAIAERGHKYYIENRVRYLCLKGIHGYAIVEGSESYIVEFEYQDGEIRNLVCECPCGYPCKHEFATMLQLRETLDEIEKSYALEFKRTEYFAAICKGTLFSFAVADNDTGSLVI